MKTLRINFNNQIKEFDIYEGIDIEETLKNINMRNLIGEYPINAIRFSSLEYDAEFVNNKLFINNKIMNNLKYICDICILIKILLNEKELTWENYKKEVINFLELGFPKLEKLEVI